MSDIIAIDFGTSNSYFALYSTNQSKPQQLLLDFGAGNRNGIDSAVLYYRRRDGKNEKSIGANALFMYHGSSPQKIKKSNMRLATSFKPDIEFSEEARKASVDFLKTIRETFKNNNTLLDLNGTLVYFGIPCNTTEDYRKRLKEIAKEAGWGNDIHMLEEPYGAVFYDLDPNNPMAFTEKNTLVIDFGGGTCDFAVISKGKIAKSWGDTFLGGRLFDDLFYQWSLEIEEEEGSNFTIPEQFDKLFNSSRRTKENFSVNRSRGLPYPYQTTTENVIMEQEEFEHRCKNYKPSEMLQNVFSTQSESARKNSKFRPDQTNDLLQWFEHTLLEGFSQQGINKNSIDHIILAGGSSCWYFVKDICKKHWPKVIPQTPSNVYAAIAEGMAKYAYTCKTLGTSVSLDYSELVEKLLGIYQEQVIPQKAIENIGGNIFDQYIKPHLWEFQLIGGKLKDVEEKAQKSLQNNWNSISAQIKRAIKANSNISESIRKETQQWLQSQGVANRHIQQLGLNINLDFNNDFVNNFDIGVGNALGPIIVSALVTGVTAAIVISGGILAPAVGIAAWLITTAMGLAIVKRFPLPASISSSVMNDEAIKSTRNDVVTAFSTEITEQYQKSLEENRDSIRNELEKFAKSIGKQYTELIDLENHNHL